MLITSYDLLRRDVDDYTANEQRFNVMALDEAQYIKNHTTKIAKAVKAVAADHRFAFDWHADRKPTFPNYGHFRLSDAGAARLI